MEGHPPMRKDRREGMKKALLENLLSKSLRLRKRFVRAIVLFWNSQRGTMAKPFPFASYMFLFCFAV